MNVFLGLISSSLRTGSPLPQVTPSPLLNRFMERPHGLNVVHEESEEDFGLPKVLTEETLESLQYLYVAAPPPLSFVTRSSSPTLSQDFQCRRVDRVCYRDASGQVDGRGQGIGRRTVPHRWACSSAVSSPRARCGDALARANNDAWTERFVKIMTLYNHHLVRRIGDGLGGMYNRMVT